MSSQAAVGQQEADSTFEESALPLAFLKQGVTDAADRMRNGLLLYPTVWLLLTQADGYALRHPGFVGGHFLGLALCSAVRLHFNRHLTQALDRDFVPTRSLFRALSVGQNLYWGALCAILLSVADATTLRWLMLISTVGITAGGTVIVAIDAVLPLAYPAAMLGPTVVALLPQGGAANYALCGLTAVFFAYSLGISRVVGRDYWSRQRVQALLEQRARELEALSRTDALTQVPNRLMFQERLAQLWRDARRRREPLAVAMVDLDFFKKINDTYGHPFGDRCLQAAARALTTAVHRPQDLVARFGGEEFVVLMPNTDLKGAQAVAERMLKQISEVVLKQGEALVVLSCSIGVACAAADHQGPADDLVQHADLALYDAKKGGRARVVCFDAGAVRPALSLVASNGTR